jgi:tRNA uridine 5-carboxymethylaminomethyl modification enzyme
MAGLNAARWASGSGPFILDRAEAYIGVLIDDLIVQGVTEPYRMFTSRAEYRLSLRADNADQRLTPRGIGVGCISAEREHVFKLKAEALRSSQALLKRSRATPNTLNSLGFVVNEDGVPRTAWQMLGYPGVTLATLAVVWPELNGIPPAIAEQLEIESRYTGYLDRQDADIRAFRRDESLELAHDLNYQEVGSLSTELRDKLTRTRPQTLGAASRIPGITPAALTALLRHVRNTTRAA